MSRAEHVAAARIAARTATRARGRTALVLALIAFPISMLAGAAILIKTALSTPQEEIRGELGTADIRIDGYPSDLTAEQVRAALPPGSKVSFALGLGSTMLVNATPYAMNITELSVAPDELPVAPRYDLRRGRWPRARDEVAVSTSVLEYFDTTVGGALVIEDLGMRLQVVGEALYREDLRRDLVLAGPGTLSTRDDAFVYDVLIDLPEGVSFDEASAMLNSKIEHLGLLGAEDLAARRRADERALTGASFAFTVLALFAVGLITAAAFGVGARRQLRSLGLVGAAGGEPRHVRAVVLWGGALTGLTGSLAGIAFAFVVVALAVPHVDPLFDRVVGPVRASWPMIFGGVLLGTIASLLSALGPARHAARIATVDALAGRAPRPLPPGRIARRGLVLAALGTAMTALAAGTKEWRMLPVALVLTVGGFLLAIPIMVTAVGRMARWLPTSFRLAARQTARYGRRTGAAVAAATLALTAPLTVGAATLSDDAHANRQPSLRDDQMLLGTLTNDTPSDSLTKEMLDAAVAAIPGAAVATTRFTKVPSPPDQEWLVVARGPNREVRPGVSTFDGGPLVIATPALLRALAAEGAADALRSGKVVALGRAIEDGKLRLEIPRLDGQGVTTRRVPAVRANVVPPGMAELPMYVVSERGARRLGFLPARASHGVLRAPRALSDRDVDRVKKALSRFPNAYANARRDYMADGGVMRLAVTAAAALVALVIVAIAVALVGAESRREHAILVAVGAGPGRRRRVVGANATLMSLLAGVLAIPAGLIPIWVIIASREEPFPIVVPWGVIGLVTVAAPLFAGLIGALLSREPKALGLLRPTW